MLRLLVNSAHFLLQVHFELSPAKTVFRRDDPADNRTRAAQIGSSSCRQRAARDSENNRKP
jgi:hypothetical protein